MKEGVQAFNFKTLFPDYNWPKGKPRDQLFVGISRPQALKYPHGGHANFLSKWSKFGKHES